MSHAHAQDRRVQRTKSALRHAMSSLVHEKPFDAIAVKEIVARANVGRSAFYAHFRDREDLLASAIRETLDACERSAPPSSGPERLLRFSRPLLDHIERAGVARHGVNRDIRDVLHARVHAALVAHLATMLPPGCVGASGMPADLLAEYVADTFLRAAHWWVAGEGKRSAADAETLFRALALPAVRAAFAPNSELVAR
jgi:AcrR family transcriptional regulator